MSSSNKNLREKKLKKKSQFFFFFFEFFSLNQQKTRDKRDNHFAFATIYIQSILKASFSIGERKFEEREKEREKVAVVIAVVVVAKKRWVVRDEKSAAPFSPRVSAPSSVLIVIIIIIILIIGRQRR